MREQVYNSNGIKAYIFRRDNNFYYLYFSEYTRRIRKSLNTADYYSALKKSFSTIDEILAGITKTPTFNKTCKDFLKTIKSKNKKKYYSERLDAVFMPHFQNKTISEIKESDINSLIFQRLEKIKPQSVNKEMVVLKQIFKYAKKCNYIITIPDIEKQKEIAARRESFSDDEIQEIISTAKTRIDEITNARSKYDREMLLQYILFLMHTGIRIGEALSIQFKNINGDYALLGKSKTIKREIFLNDNAKQAIENIKTIYEKYKITYDNQSFLFLNYQARPIKSFKKSFNALLSATSMKDMVGKNLLTLYSFRHFYITSAIKTGIPLTTIAIQCGTSLKMIQKNYNHLTIHQVKNDLK